MSLQDTKDQLTYLITSDENKVIALSGKWGTGKSHMWEEVRKASRDERVKGALYASLFGLSTLDQVKMKLIQSAVPGIESNPGLWDGTKKALRTTVRALEGFHKAFGALNDIGLIFAPAVLRGRLIVLDDIERKHEKLSIDEVLGFIDELTKQHQSRFIVILNSDQLHRRDVWETLREKVIDQELKLETTAAEAFKIAEMALACPHRELVEQGVADCEITNIRVIQKIIRTVSRILKPYAELPSAVLVRVIPSIVLLAAIHYRGIDNGPTLDYVLTRADPQVEPPAANSKGEPESASATATWKLLLSKVGIGEADDFELSVIDFLQSGLLDSTRVSKVIDRYLDETEVMEARSDYYNYMDRLVWDHSLTEIELIAQAERLVPKAHFLDAYAVTSLSNEVSMLAGGQATADLLIEKWIAQFRTRSLDNVGDDGFRPRSLHPLIEAEFATISARAQANTSVYDACIYIAQKSGWGERQQVAMRTATVNDMEITIRTAPIPGLRVFMIKMLELLARKSDYEQFFGSAMDNFALACKNIANDPKSSRLANLVRTMFTNVKLDSLL